jgi:FG-GAP-like repeat
VLLIAFYGAGIVPNYVATADLNHDGIADLAVAGGSGFSVLLGKGAGGFGPPLVLPQITPSFYLTLADFNNDGNIDLLTSRAAQESRSVPR